MAALLDITGERYGRLTVLRFAGRRRNRTSWLCRCDCGQEVEVETARLRSGNTRSCGCLHAETSAATGRAQRRHGYTDTPTYHSWRSMWQRCTYPRDINFKNYGGRGITVCERWRMFESFLSDMGPRPAGTSLDRYPDKDGNYEPGNCRWATPYQQTRNRRANRPINAFGETRLADGWSALAGVRADTILHRLDFGWSPERAVSTPTLNRGPRGGVR